MRRRARSKKRKGRLLPFIPSTEGDQDDPQTDEEYPQETKGSYGIAEEQVGEEDDEGEVQADEGINIGEVRTGERN